VNSKKELSSEDNDFLSIVTLTVLFHHNPFAVVKMRCRSASQPSLPACRFCY